MNRLQIGGGWREAGVRVLSCALAVFKETGSDFRPQLSSESLFSSSVSPLDQQAPCSPLNFRGEDKAMFCHNVIATIMMISWLFAG